jgi:hypothetical protein
MKRYVKYVLVVILIVAMAGSASLLVIPPRTASACGFGGVGGNDYVPQRRNSPGYLTNKTAITAEQAREIVSSHVRKLNPNLEVGRVNDAGGFFEAEILSTDKEVVQLMGIDKFSGRLMPIR